MDFDGTLKFDTALDESGFQAGLGELGNLAQKGLEAVKSTATMAVEAVVNIGKNAVESGQSFEKSMSQVMATMGITKETAQGDYELLKNAAADAGKRTAFSATQAGEALNHLALAGYDAGKATDVLETVLNLASAGGLDLSYATSLATNSMAALGIEANKENLTHFGDQMAKTASRANTSVAELGEAILTIGGTAKELSGGTTELDALFGVLANRSITSSEAGTHLRNIILSLVAPTDTAAAKLEELGVSATDAEGNLRPLNEVMADLQNAGATTADLNTIFNKTDLASVQALIAGCGEEYQNLVNEIDNADDAMQNMADAMLDNLEGDRTILDSATEGFYNAIYDSMNGGLREIVQLATSYVSRLTDALENGGFEGLANELGNIIGEAVTQVAKYLPDIVNVGRTFATSLFKSLLGNSETILNTAIEIVGILFDGFDDGFSENLELLVNTGIRLLEILVQAIVDNLDIILATGFQIVQVVCDVLSDGENLGKLLDIGKQLLDYIVNGVKENFPKIRPAIVELIGKMGEYFKEHYKEMLEYGGELIKKVANGLKEAATVLLGEVVLLLDDLGDEFSEYGWLTIGADIVGKIGEGIKTMYDHAVDYTTDLIEKIVNAIKETDWIKLGKDICDGILSGLVGFDADFYDYLDYFKGDFLGGLFKTFEIGSPSKVMRDEVGKYLAEGIGVGFADNIPDVGEDALNAFRLQSADVFGTVRSSPTSEITHNYTYYNSTQNADGSHSQRGDIIIPVSIGGQEIETFIFSAIQLENMRTGGGTV